MDEAIRYDVTIVGCELPSLPVGSFTFCDFEKKNKIYSTIAPNIIYDTTCLREHLI